MTHASLKTIHLRECPRQHLQNGPNVCTATLNVINDCLTSCHSDLKRLRLDMKTFRLMKPHNSGWIKQSSRASQA